MKEPKFKVGEIAYTIMEPWRTPHIVDKIRIMESYKGKEERQYNISILDDKMLVFGGAIQKESLISWNSKDIELRCAQTLITQYTKEKEFHVAQVRGLNKSIKNLKEKILRFPNIMN